MDPQDSTETWKPVPGYEGRYEVSDLGRVRSIFRQKPHVLAPWSRHRQIWLTKDGQKRKALVHRLVLLAFVGPPPQKYECCHQDDDPSNNRLSNLYWGTRSQNKFDAVRNGKHACGERHPSTVLTWDDIDSIRAAAKTETYKGIAGRYPVTAGTIRNIVLEITWRRTNS